MEEEAKKPNIIDMRRLHPEEREAFRDALKMARGPNFTAVMGMMFLAAMFGLTLGLLLGIWGTVPEEKAVLYGHGEYVEGEFRWNGTDCGNQK